VCVCGQQPRLITFDLGSLYVRRSWGKPAKTSSAKKHGTVAYGPTAAVWTAVDAW